MINALQGTWMGRKVKTAQEAIDDAKEWADQKGLEDKVQVDSGSTAPLPKFDMPLTANGYYDYFKFSKLETEHNESVLTNLELPTGTWSELRLHSDVETFTQSEFFGFSDGSLMNDGGKSVPASRRISPINHICPLRVQYWFFRAAYQKFMESSGTFIDPLIESFRSKILTGYHYAETIQWLDSGNPNVSAKIGIGGWPDQHPLSTFKISGAIPSNVGEISLGSNLRYIPMITMMLFDDPDPIRVDNVLRFATGNLMSAIPLKLSPRRLLSHSLLFERNGRKLNLAGNPMESRYAQWLYAPEKNFTPRKVGL